MIAVAILTFKEPGAYSYFLTDMDVTFQSRISDKRVFVNIITQKVIR